MRDLLLSAKKHVSRRCKQQIFSDSYKITTASHGRFFSIKSLNEEVLEFRTENQKMDTESQRQISSNVLPETLAMTFDV
jgi:hypothetical protein